jgi:hypothetical protein
MSILVEDPALSRRRSGRGMMLTIGLLTAFLGGVVLFVLVIAPGIGAAGGCGGG